MSRRYRQPPVLFCRDETPLSVIEVCGVICHVAAAILRRAMPVIGMRL